MNKIYKFVYLTLITCAAFLSSCQEDEKSSAKPGHVRFTINPRAQSDATGGRVTQNLPEGARLYVTIENAAGEEIYALHEVTLVAMGDYVVGQPLALNTGDYVLTKFIIATDEISYVTPQEGSPMAQWVDDPLPIPFSIHDNSVAALDVQVIPFYETNTPQDFGYVGFDIEVAPYPFFNLSVFKPDGNTFAFTPVHAYILDESDTIYNEVLPAGINKIAFVGEMDGIYDLVLTQAGYRKHTQTFVLRNLLEGVVVGGKKAVEVTLQPAFTFVTRWGFDVAFRIHGPADNLFIDWGDGDVMPVAAIRDIADRAEHAYGREGQFFVSVYGSDLSSVNGLEFYYGDGSALEVTLDHVPALRQFDMSFADSPEVIDFSHNPHISSIQMAVSDVRAFILPEAPPLHDVSLVYQTGFSQTSLDELIHAAYLNAVTNNVWQGWLYLSDTPNGSGFIAYPSEQSLQELRALRDSYNWVIWPENLD